MASAGRRALSGRFEPNYNSFCRSGTRIDPGHSDRIARAAEGRRTRCTSGAGAVTCTRQPPSISMWMESH